MPKHIFRLAVSYILLTISWPPSIWMGRLLLSIVPTAKPYLFTKRPSWAISTTFITPKLVMVCTNEKGTFFVSLHSFDCVAQLNHGVESRLRVSTILGDGRVCVSRNKGYAVLLSPPSSVKDTVPVPVLLLLPYSNPVRAAWKAVECGAISLREAIELAATSKYSTSCFAEWVVAHKIVVRGVREGVIPPDRKYKGEIRYGSRRMWNSGSGVLRNWTRKVHNGALYA